jgi:hypothetical protein
MKMSFGGSIPFLKPDRNLPDGRRKRPDSDMPGSCVNPRFTYSSSCSDLIPKTEFEQEHQ